MNIYDAILGEMCGTELAYPQQLGIILNHLSILRQRENEPIDPYVFYDTVQLPNAPGGLQ